jgi:hypothetical protein
MTAMLAKQYEGVLIYFILNWLHLLELEFTEISSSVTDPGISY